MSHSPLSWDSTTDKAQNHIIIVYIQTIKDGLPHQSLLMLTALTSDLRGSATWNIITNKKKRKNVKKVVNLFVSFIYGHRERGLGFYPNKICPEKITPPPFSTPLNLKLLKLFTKYSVY